MTLSSAVFTFLKDLQNNNERDWFSAHKDRYEAARGEFEKIVSALIAEVGSFDPAVAGLEARKCIFRIYRDVRFSKDKTPYKTNFSAYLSGAEKQSEVRAGYYLSLEPGKSLIGGGAYLPPAPWLKAIREEIDYRGEDLRSIITHPSFRKYFGAMEGEQLKRMPKGYDEDHEHIDLLKYKSYTGFHQLSDMVVTSPSFVKHAADVFRAIKPLNDFLNNAQEGMGE